MFISVLPLFQPLAPFPVIFFWRKSPLAHLQPQTTKPPVNIFPYIIFNLNQILYCDYSLESSRRDDSTNGHNKGICREIRKQALVTTHNRLEHLCNWPSDVDLRAQTDHHWLQLPSPQTQFTLSPPITTKLP